MLFSYLKSPPDLKVQTTVPIIGCQPKLFGTVAPRDKSVQKSVDRNFRDQNIRGDATTNNAAERALRLAVIWRKTCFGSLSEGGVIDRTMLYQSICGRLHQI